MPQLIGGLIAIPIVITIISLILNAILAGLLVLTYSSLTEEQVIATIQFDKIENTENIYIAHLYEADGSKIGDYKIYGDQWRMDAGFIKMEYWANVFGVDSKYTLNRFEGRYKDIEKENNNKHKAYQLESHSIIDTFSFLVDATYGSSVYKEIKINTEYTVLKSQTGLIVRVKYIEPKEKKGILDTMKSWVG
ncbi:MAG: hypothetical protein ISEC1_P1146 [Thiomicrorhabdus sp.]|nr:MAG: hypothetical protein ISEC1_P1146 [Thiomicrorhabdus sp.]